MEKTRASTPPSFSITSTRIRNRAPRMSLIVWYGWNGILSESDGIPEVLLDPVS